MKKTALALLAALTVLTASTGHAQLLITGIFDGPLTGGLPKGIEFYVTEDIADLSLFQLANYNNGGASASATFNLSGSASAGSFLYYAYTLADNAGVTGFTDFFGFAPTFSGLPLNVNGDDAVAIRLTATSAVVDVYGVIGTDGTGQPWEYLDGWAYRTNGSSASATFNSAEWTYSGVDSYDGATTNAGANSPLPIGTFNPVPEPGTVALIGLGLGVGLLAMRRRRA